MAHARDILQGVVDGLGGLVAVLPQGDWKQVASHLAAPGQQQIIQQQQQIIQQQQQILNQQQQVSEQQHQAIPQIQATLQAVQQQLQQMQGTLHQMQQQTEAKFHQMQQQTQTTLQDVLQEQQQMQQDLAVIRWTQANAAIRFQNKRGLEHLHPLHKERQGGNSPAGDLPSADGQFPATYTAVFGLSNSELTKLETFYQVQFAGPLVQERRRAFWEYISEPAAS
ncbi:hypothetical protein Ndes2526B_g06848 [Nannochloris sp. 'desiccata']|nr:hypothetical protein KSW81_005049 [Chlorella desiccata (nom. nud.)]KAH7617957.1 hypothetical protein NADE_000159 [Chlorella desiccata (nom. nud.)]